MNKQLKRKIRRKIIIGLNDPMDVFMVPLQPSTVDVEKIKATYKDGLLEVMLPKTEAAKAKSIPVDVTE